MRPDAPPLSHALSLHDALPISFRARAVGRLTDERDGFGDRFAARRLKRVGRRAAKRSPKPSDRKSTRLNSSHVSISYAVFCLKKKIRRHRAVATLLWAFLALAA